jgi:hypothetical protein
MGMVVVGAFPADPEDIESLEIDPEIAAVAEHVAEQAREHGVSYVGGLASSLSGSLIFTTEEFGNKLEALTNGIRGEGAKEAVEDLMEAWTEMMSATQRITELLGTMSVMAGIMQEPRPDSQWPEELRRAFAHVIQSSVNGQVQHAAEKRRARMAAKGRNH